MLFGDNRQQIRRQFIDVWTKHRLKMSLEPLEQMMANVIEQHPEYHPLLENPDSLEKEFLPETGQTNPFLHMGMHIAILEQATTNRPDGILDIYQNLITKSQNSHQAEHKIMECLGEALWQAQLNNAMPNEADYLECLRKIEKR